MSSISLSKDQERILQILMRWYNKKFPTPFLTVGGYAGTGKTTLISIFSNEIHRIDKKIKIAFVSYTGKAARVLQNKLNEAKAVFKTDRVSTIHSLIYSPIESKNGIIIGWKLKDDVPFNLIVVDEASMVDEKIWKDLLSYKIPILAFGDIGQLPPIGSTFNLMASPHLRLDQIHRQAENNPIIDLSIRARTNGFIPYGTFGTNIKKLKKGDYDVFDLLDDIFTDTSKNTLILCGYNNTRVKLNNYIRGKLGFESELPQRGDKVICLRNNHEKEIFNGMRGIIEKINSHDENWYNTSIQIEDSYGLYEGKIYKKQFNNLEPINFTKNRMLAMGGDLFDFGYALTVHKAQGSQAERVVLFEERFSRMDDNDWKRWLYTAVTRAEKELIIIG
ncbi:hypothetical protein COV24_01830 [candidate division WWE3 bacterium CG10_big_fil_rev_8_21_14_0_10_32_10]|uniref:UvrD-like helicase C-terminal domain-containing protein n=1 Tax=candidate division WWE3 bacterium CG10_big_fil_rev_8_21_14_0_10_32_10 TaxID=1975090 RepID=A0A2H0RAQ3_UNCKA|nr:MAG: hypothetical protein COV24_01830 [candidate division WWE3 bacterium CG10_big_fil_rev_8_21_14_0_10_32_10]